MSDTVTVTLVEHPLVADSLARIRDRDTPNALFRQNLERIGTLLLAEATRTLPEISSCQKALSSLIAMWSSQAANSSRNCTTCSGVSSDSSSRVASRRASSARRSSLPRVPVSPAVRSRMPAL